MKRLTKSRFKLGVDCPNKLFYTNKKQYANVQTEDSFLAALANGGFQVEALARATYANGYFVDVEHYDYEGAVHQTVNQLTKDHAVIFEAAFAYESLFVRTDIVEKKGNTIRLIEVKAKSFYASEQYTFVGKRGGLDRKWKMYLFDLAFQKYVAQLNYPEYTFEAYLYLADKDKTATIDGLNQMYRVASNADPRKNVSQNHLTYDEIMSTNVLTEVNVDDIINDILNNKYPVLEGKTFAESVSYLSDLYANDQYAHVPVQFSTCKICEFRATTTQKEEGMKCGFTECFQKQKGWSEKEFQDPKIFELWNFRNGHKLVEEDRWFLSQLTIEDFKTGDHPDKLTVGDRQWLQVCKANEKDTDNYVEREGLQQCMDQWNYPLHFIDFETSRVALPFTESRRPYEQVAFQFSHHIYYEDGRIEHKSEYINNSAGKFPNFEFVRTLKKSLSSDNGSIFRFSNHENSVLNDIIVQLTESDEEDCYELIEFIKEITYEKKDKKIIRCGERNMIDLCQVIKDFYYNPLTRGSNSIKYVLPAILQKSTFLQQKYSQTLQEIGINSHNFSPNHRWLTIENGGVVNPYRMLPPLFEGWDEFEKAETISEMEDVADGGAALTAYAKLQYVDMSDKEREELTQALLKYCELDTLAMVMLYEHLLHDCI